MNPSSLFCLKVNSNFLLNSSESNETIFKQNNFSNKLLQSEIIGFNTIEILAYQNSVDMEKSLIF